MAKPNGLLSILTGSDKRTGILFLLQKKPQTLTEIKDYFDVESPEILPRLKQMEAANIIVRDDDKVYSITELGKLFAKYYKPLLDTVQSVEANQHFWGCHDLSAIPEKSFLNLKDLRNCTVISEELSNIYDSHPRFINAVKESKVFRGFTSVFFPLWPKLFLSLAKQGIPVSIIVTKGVYEKILADYAYELEEGLKFEHASMYVLHEEEKIAFGLTDKFFTLSLYLKNGAYDPRNDLIGNDPSSIKWGDSLFEYYKDKSVKIECLPAPNEYIFTNRTIKEASTDYIDYL